MRAKKKTALQRNKDTSGNKNENEQHIVWQGKWRRGIISGRQMAAPAVDLWKKKESIQ